MFVAIVDISNSNLTSFLFLDQRSWWKLEEFTANNGILRMSLVILHAQCDIRIYIKLQFKMAVFDNFDINDADFSEPRTELIV